MAVGDAVVGDSSISNNSYLDIQPSLGAEWFIHSIFHADAVEIHWYDGSNDILVGSPTGPNWEAISARVTNDIYLRVKNIAGATMSIGYSGVVSK